METSKKIDFLNKTISYSIRSQLFKAENCSFTSRVIKIHYLCVFFKFNDFSYSQISTTIKQCSI
jgi:hypothetical protein